MSPYILSGTSIPSSCIPFCTVRDTFRERIYLKLLIASFSSFNIE